MLLFEIALTLSLMAYAACVSSLAYVLFIELKELLRQGREQRSLPSQGHPDSTLLDFVSKVSR